MIFLSFTHPESFDSQYHPPNLFRVSEGLTPRARLQGFLNMSQQQQNEVAKETSVSSLRLSRAPRPSFQNGFRHVRFVLWGWARKFSGVYFRIRRRRTMWKMSQTSGPLWPMPTATQTPTQRRMPDWIMTLAAAKGLQHDPNTCQLGRSPNPCWRQSRSGALPLKSPVSGSRALSTPQGAPGESPAAQQGRSARPAPKTDLVSSIHREQPSLDPEAESVNAPDYRSFKAPWQASVARATSTMRKHPVHTSAALLRS